MGRFTAILLFIAILLCYPRLTHEVEMIKEDALTIMKFTIALEAESEPWVGKLGVGWVFSNRMTIWKQSAARVAWTPSQFSCWLIEYNFISRLDRIDDTIMNVAGQAAQLAYDRVGIDPTNGATHYLNVEVTKRQRGGTLPDWVHKMTEVAVIGQHTFYK